MNQMSHQLQQQAAAPRPAYGSGAQASGWQHCTSPPVGSQQLLGTTSPPIPQASPFVRPPYPQGCGTMKEMYVQGPQAAPLQQQQQQGAGGYPLGYGQRPQTLPLQDNAVDVAPGTPSGGYRGSIPPPQQGAAYGYRRPPRYPYPSQLSPVATPSPQGSQYNTPHNHYPGTPLAYPVPSPAPGTPSTPTMQGPPPYATPNTPTDPSYYGNIQSLHSPRFLDSGVMGMAVQSPPNYVQVQPNAMHYSQYPSMPYSVGMMEKREGDPLRLTFPVREGVLLRPFQIEHGRSISQRIFQLKESVHKMLMQRNDLEIQFKCYHHDDKQQLCNWPQGVSVSIGGNILCIDRGDSKTSTSHRPLHLKQFCQPSQNLLEIAVTACCCSHFFILQLVHRPSVNSVLQGLLRKRLLPTEHCIAKIKRQFTNSEDGIQQTKTKVPLKCPLTFKRITLPARGAECRHIQCFDLEAYLQLNCERTTWKCPVCGSNAQLEGLEVDQYIGIILAELAKKKMNVDEITIDPHAVWQPVDKEPDTCKDEEDMPPSKKVKAEVTNPPTPVQRAMGTPPANNPCVKRSHSGINGTNFPGPTPPSSHISAPSPGRLPVTRTASNTSLHDPTAVQLPSIPPPSNPPPSNPPSGHQLAADDIDGLSFFDSIGDDELLNCLNDDLPSHELLSILD